MSVVDLDLLVKGSEGLPCMDFLGHADPYFILTITTPDGKEVVNHKSLVIYNTATPIWNEELIFSNVPAGTRLHFKIMDKDHLTAHDPIGDCEVVLDAVLLDRALVATAIAETGTAGTATAATAAAAPTAANGAKGAMAGGGGSDGSATADASPRARVSSNGTFLGSFLGGSSGCPTPPTRSTSPSVSAAPAPAGAADAAAQAASSSSSSGQCASGPTAPPPSRKTSWLGRLSRGSTGSKPSRASYSGGDGEGAAGVSVQNTSANGMSTANRGGDGRSSSSSSDLIAGLQLRVAIRGAPSVPAAAGFLLLKLGCRPPSSAPGPVLHRGPVRYRVASSWVAGKLTGHTDADGWQAYAAYKLSLAGLREFFPNGAEQPWNREYDKARQVFQTPAMVAAVKAQHSLLYADTGRQPHKQRGMLRGGGDLVALLRGGVRAGQRRYYTYAIKDDASLCFSETGAEFFSDFMSKHAMHANMADKVVYAGEFCLVPPGLMPPALAAVVAVTQPPAAASSQSQTERLGARTSASTTPRGASQADLSEQALADFTSGGNGSSQAPSSLTRATPISLDPPAVDAVEAAVADSPFTAVASAHFDAAAAATDAAMAEAAAARSSGTHANGWTIVIDNNSGTYAPAASALPALAALLTHNFPGLAVVVVDTPNEKALLAAIHKRIPSRCPPRK